MITNYSRYFNNLFDKSYWGKVLLHNNSELITLEILKNREEFISNFDISKSFKITCFPERFLYGSFFNRLELYSFFCGFVILTHPLLEDPNMLQTFSERKQFLEYQSKKWEFTEYDPLYSTISATYFRTFSNRKDLNIFLKNKNRI
jgi:hypothetical protein